MHTYSPQLITNGDTREEDLTTMAKALDNYCIKGNYLTDKLSSKPLWSCININSYLFSQGIYQKHEKFIIQIFPLYSIVTAGKTEHMGM